MYCVLSVHKGLDIHIIQALFCIPDYMRMLISKIDEPLDIMLQIGKYMNTIEGIPTDRTALEERHEAVLNVNPEIQAFRCLDNIVAFNLFWNKPPTLYQNISL